MADVLLLEKPASWQRKLFIKRVKELKTIFLALLQTKHCSGVFHMLAQLSSQESGEIAITVPSHRQEAAEMAEGSRAGKWKDQKRM